MEDIKKYGYIEDAIKDEDYIFGAGNVPDDILQPDGQWDAFLPDNEPQAKNFDTFGCTIFGTLNILEILKKRKFGDAENESDRFVYIGTDTLPPGNSPQTIAEWIRHNGIIPEKDLPWDDSIDSLAKFCQPKPLTDSLARNGKEWLNRYIYRHEWVGTTPAEMKEALKHSPLGVAVYAWNKQGDYYVRSGQDVHWTAIYGYEDGKYWKCYDSYSEYQKKLAWDFSFTRVKRYYLEKNEIYPQQLNIFQQILNVIAQWLGLIQKELPKMPEPPKIIDSVPIEDIKPINKPMEIKKSRIPDWSKAISVCEGYGTAKARTITANFNPGAIRNKQGQMLKFASEKEGFDYLQDYLKRVCEGKHVAYPKGGETTLTQFTKIYVGPDYNYAPKIAVLLGVQPDIKIKELA